MMNIEMRKITKDALYGGFYQKGVIYEQCKTCVR